jgi:sec-independent protein translocase protein TatA
MGLDNPLHIAFLLMVLLLVFGAKRLPEMGRSLGDGLRGFKESVSGEHTTVNALTTSPETTEPMVQAVTVEQPEEVSVPAHTATVA